MRREDGGVAGGRGLAGSCDTMGGRDFSRIVRRVAARRALLGRSDTLGGGEFSGILGDGGIRNFGAIIL